MDIASLQGRFVLESSICSFCQLCLSGEAGFLIEGIRLDITSIRSYIRFVYKVICSYQ